MSEVQRLEKIVEVCFNDPCFHEKVTTEELLDTTPKTLFFYGRLVEPEDPRYVRVISFYDSTGGEHDMIALPIGTVEHVRLLKTGKYLYRRDK